MLPQSRPPTPAPRPHAGLCFQPRRMSVSPSQARRPTRKRKRGRCLQAGLPQHSVRPRATTRDPGAAPTLVSCVAAGGTQVRSRACSAAGDSTLRDARRRGSPRLLEGGCSAQRSGGPAPAARALRGAWSAPSGGVWGSLLALVLFGSYASSRVAHPRDLGLRILCAPHSRAPGQMA